MKADFLLHIWSRFEMRLQLDLYPFPHLMRLFDALLVIQRHLISRLSQIYLDTM